MNYRKFNSKFNVTGEYIRNARIEKHFTRPYVCKQLDLYGINFHVNELYKIEHGEKALKDFELIALCIILDLDYDVLRLYSPRLPLKPAVQT